MYTIFIQISINELKSLTIKVLLNTFVTKKDVCILW